MSLGQLSFNFFSAAMPVIVASSCIIGALLLLSFTLLHYSQLKAFIRRFILRRPQYDYRKIFQDYLERFSCIEDRREMYPAILSAVCRIVGAEGASLIIRDAKDRLQMKAAFGLKPFGFEVSEMMGFVSWFEKSRQVVTRTDLLAGNKFKEVKSEGLRWFVQFNAEAVVPLFVGDRLYGIINVGERKKGFFDSETRDLLRLLSVQFATAIHNANLFQALLNQNTKLQEASTFKTQLLSNVSHELRTPLTSIIGLSELIAEGGDGQINDEQKKHLEIVCQSGRRLLNTVSAMLDLSKLEVNRLELNVQKINFSKLVSSVIGDVHPNSKTELEVVLGDDVPGVYGDEERLRQVMKHLLDNAAKFTKQGKISVDAEKCGEMLKVSISDTGIGIDKDKQKSIFECFRQADSGMTRQYEGLGLGLTISKKLVELHGGRMWLASKVGKGSSFNFTLPLKPAGVYSDKSMSPRLAS